MAPKSRLPKIGQTTSKRLPGVNTCVRDPAVTCIFRKAAEVISPHTSVKAPPGQSNGFKARFRRAPHIHNPGHVTLH